MNLIAVATCMLSGVSVYVFTRWLLRLWNADVARAQAEDRASTVERRVRAAENRAELAESALRDSPTKDLLGKSREEVTRLMRELDALDQKEFELTVDNGRLHRELEASRIEAAKRTGVLSQLQAQVAALDVTLNTSCLVCGGVHECPRGIKAAKDVVRETERWVETQAPKHRPMKWDERRDW